MRILLTTHQFLPEFSSGTEILTYSVARQLIKQGHEVRILTGYPGLVNLADADRFDEYDFENIHVYRFHHAYTPMGEQISLIEIGYNNQLSRVNFELILDKFKPNVVHYFHLNRLGSALIESTANRNIPQFFTPTDFWFICPTAQLLLPNGNLCLGPTPYAANCVKHLAMSAKNSKMSTLAQHIPTFLLEFLCQSTSKFLPKYPKYIEVKAIGTRLKCNIGRINKLNGIVAPTEFIRELLIRYGVSSDLITLSRFGIDPIVSKTIDDHRAVPHPLRIGFIGTLAPHKGCHILIEAFKSLPAGKATLKIYGNLGDFPTYSKKINLLTIGHTAIEFKGTFLNSDIGKIFENIDVLVIPSIWYENTPLVLYSAQAARCPVVASALPGMSEVIQDEEDGLLFSAGNVGDLTAQLSRLIHTELLLPRLRNNSRSPKTTEIYVDELLGLWQTAVVNDAQ
jgi:glycosyltransferase involved in cell wall biosynthesis